MYQQNFQSKLLSEIFNPPQKLYGKGSFTEGIFVAIVGTRRATQEGMSNAKHIAGLLAEHNITVVSGLARGIDSSAHIGALKSKGITIAVLPGGIDFVYPSSNLWLAKRIVENGGALLSEHPGKYKPMKHDFLARNRIIAGLCQLTIVVEAGQRSGALNTARHALENNREVMAVPGSINNPQSIGTNNLIKMGAEPITKPEDVLDYLNIEKKQKTAITVNRQQQKVLNFLNKQSYQIDEILNKVDYSSEYLLRLLTEMEIIGLIERLPNNYIRIRR